jgi:Zn-dependent protease with chaperone function
LFPLSLYLDFFVDYFSKNFILLGLVLAVSLIVVFFAAFKRGKSAQVRSKYLISMSVISTSIWVYVLSSLALCMLMVQNYWEDPVSAIMLVSKLALGVTFCLGLASVFVFQRRVLHRAFESIASQSHPLVTIAESSSATTTKANISLSQILSKLNEKGSAIVSVQAVTIKSTSSLPDSLAFDSRKLKLIGVKEDVPLLLDEDELEAVLAHELGHIVHKDAFQKSLATAYKVAFPFDLLARLVEAACIEKGN